MDPDNSVIKRLWCNMFYLTELNKDDNSHSSDVCFHILVRTRDMNFSEVLSIFYFSLFYILTSQIDEYFYNMKL